jgi:asparagine synthetase B (glutamine-hydrolysing)
MKVICFLLRNNIVSSERLSIIDLNSGKQPIQELQRLDGAYWRNL